MLEIKPDHMYKDDFDGLLTIKEFNDRTPRIEICPAVYYKCKNLYVTWRYDADTWEKDLFNLQCIMDELEGRIPVHLFMTYLPNARMDRPGKFAQDRETGAPYQLFTLKTFAKIINGMNFATVTLFDPHSDVSLALLDRVVADIDPGWNYFQILEKLEDPVAVFPDNGALKRYRKRMPKEVPKTFCEKIRDFDTQHVTGMYLFDADFVKGKDVLLIDDIISHGYTMYLAIKALMDCEPKSITIFATHIEESFKDGILYQKLEEGEIKAEIYTTNSIIRKWEEVPEYFHEMEA